MRARPAFSWPLAVHAAVVACTAGAALWHGAPGLLAQGAQALQLRPRDGTWQQAPLVVALQELAAALPTDGPVQVVLATTDPEVLATYMAVSYWLLPRPCRPALSLDVLGSSDPALRHAVVLTTQVPTLPGWRLRAQFPVAPWLLCWLERDAR